jgi:hypothetical protein
MTTHLTGTRDEWLTARRALLDAEKTLTRAATRSHGVARRCRGCVDKTYRFDTEHGAATLDDLFDGRSQLLVITSCSAPTTRPAARRARRSPTASTVSPSISRTTTTLAAVRARAAREAAGVPAAHGLAVSWRRRKAARSISTSACRSPKRSSAPATSNTTMRAAHAMDVDPPPAAVAQFAATCAPMPRRMRATARG